MTAPNRALPGVRGNGMASRTLARPVTQARVRSKPRPKAGVGDCAVAPQIAIPGLRVLVEAAFGHSLAKTSSRSSRCLPPMIWPTPDANTSIAATVRPSSFNRLARALITFGSSSR